MKEIIITGASGFLGQHLVSVATEVCPDAILLPIYSPRYGGVDLAQPNADEVFAANIQVIDPRNAVLVHTAAAVGWNSPNGLLRNVAMALNIAQWAKTLDIGFCIFVSSVSVYPLLSSVNIQTPCKPANLYGLGKLMAEEVWRLLLSPERSAVVRLAGIWGWQRQPTLFWNRLLLAAARGSKGEETPVVRRARSRRNYISVREANVCLLEIGLSKLSGLFLGAGKDSVDIASFIRALQDLPDSKLAVRWQDDGEEDVNIYQPSAELLPWLSSFDKELSAFWANKPQWV